jgi:hypothetical protein
LGIAAALVLLVGGSIAFASQQLDKGRGQTPVAVGPPAPPALTVLPPAAAITRATTIDLTAVTPANLRDDQRYTVRVFVNDKPVDRVDLPGHDQFTLKDIPLDEGVNSIRTTLVGSGGESPFSAAIAITRDDVPPVIRILEPTDRVYTDTELLQGKTEAGADIQISDGAGHDIEATISADGRFSAPLELNVGNNDLTLRSTDLAGNKTTNSATIVRAPSAASIVLSVTPTELYAPGLPATVELTATVRDELGRPLDGAVVTFGVSPPDRETTTYAATAENGRARFDGLRIDPGDANGAWLVTALATLPSGVELRADSSFSLLPNAPKSPGRH